MTGARDGEAPESTPGRPAADRWPTQAGPGERPMPVALDVDGVGVVTLGTALWAVALVVALVLHDSLRRHGHTWWIAAAACGFGLGLLGIAYCRRRVGRRS